MRRRLLCKIWVKLSYSIDPHRQIENIFFEILLVNSKLTTAGTTNISLTQSNFLEVLSNDMNITDSVNNEV